jgi:hypothetical protein
MGVDERQMLKAIDTNVRNVVMEDKKQEAWVLTNSISTQEGVLEEVIHEHMTESSFQQAKLDPWPHGNHHPQKFPH